jgi:hypothetical protein
MISFYFFKYHFSIRSSRPTNSRSWPCINLIRLVQTLHFICRNQSSNSRILYIFIFKSEIITTKLFAKKKWPSWLFHVCLIWSLIYLIIYTCKSYNFFFIFLKYSSKQIQHFIANIYFYLLVKKHNKKDI